MKKVGIITINDYRNYGNRLQNYAVQEVIKSLGFEAETIINTYKVSRIDRLRNIENKSLLYIINKILHKIKNKLNRDNKKYTILNNKRVKSFKKFTNQYIKETNFEINQNNIPEDLSEKYDFFIVGSDQVWNPHFRKNSPIDFLTFAPSNKRIAYAASFGISELPREFIEDYKDRLSQMAYISVREDAGAKIVKDLIGREVPVLIDPTLMLNKEEWFSIMKQAKNKPQVPYLLTYFLGEISFENKKWIYSFAKENNLEIVNLADIKDEERYLADPAEFLDYINSSEVLFTDSFHGAIFSILFEKPFIVFNRISTTQSMNSRIDTLLSKFNLESRRWDNIKNTNDILSIDFAHVQKILKAEREKALKYLKNALDITKDRK